MAFRFSRALTVATACLVPLVTLLPMCAVGCGASDSTTRGTPATDDTTVPLMLDGLYVNQTPTSGPYSQVSFIGYTGRYIAQTTPCADPDTGACVITATQAATDDYTTATSSETVTIAKGTPTIGFNLPGTGTRIRHGPGRLSAIALRRAKSSSFVMMTAAVAIA